MKLIPYEEKHLDAVMADLKPVLRARLDQVEGFEEVVKRSPFAVTLIDTVPVGCAWFFPLSDHTCIVTALSSNGLKAKRGFLPLCRAALDEAMEFFGCRDLLAHVHGSFPSSAGWVEKLGFKAIGYHDGLTEYRYEPETTH